MPTKRRKGTGSLARLKSATLVKRLARSSLPSFQKRKGTLLRTRLQPSMLALAVVPLVLGAVAYTVVGGFVSMAAQTDTIGIGMPFSGKWGYDASTHPSQ